MSVKDYAPLRNTVDLVILATEDEACINKRSVPRKCLQVLLVKRDEEPYNGMWVLPGGFVGANQTLTQCVDSKLYEKTGITRLHREQLYTYGEDINRDPRDRVITIAYIALAYKPKLMTESINSKGSERSAWFWVRTEREKDTVTKDFKVKSIYFESVDTGEKVDKLGFDHTYIVSDAIDRLAGKLLYTNIGFNLVDELFTVKELEMAYEAVVGRHIPGFRRIIYTKIQETNLYANDIKEKPDLHRPAKLYRIKE